MQEALNQQLNILSASASMVCLPEKSQRAASSILHSHRAPVISPAPPEQIHAQCLAKRTLCLPSSPRPQHHADPESKLTGWDIASTHCVSWITGKGWKVEKYAAQQSIAAVTKCGTFPSHCISPRNGGHVKAASSTAQPCQQMCDMAKYNDPSEAVSFTC